MKRKFYDIHFHSLDLSHANLLAFLSRISFFSTIDLNEPKKGFFKSIGNYCSLIKTVIGRKKTKFRKVRNLLSFMESSIKYDFLILEHFIKHPKYDTVLNANNKITIEDQEYDKIVLCPLIIDFGYQNKNQSDLAYDIPPQKPIQEQVIDLLQSIHTYYHYNTSIKSKANGKGKYLKFTPNGHNKENKLFEIYPFLGINPCNYGLDEIEEILNKYFKGFKNDTPEERQRKLYNKMGTFNDHNLKGDNLNYLFTGIKIYPPLGFNPWPENDQTEFEKANYIYNFCVENKIPITTHCSDGGFAVCSNAKEITNPGNSWAKVLENYPELKLNFAHFGSQSSRRKTSWQKSVIDHALKYPNVFTDFSCIAFSEKYYKKLGKIVKREKPELQNKILFGSDFLINLLWSKSYNEYLNTFIKTENIEQKHLFCSENAETFLFGDVIANDKDQKKSSSEMIEA
ncbi:MAG: amidohydrolase family protein [Bacteroidales bacterium]